MLGSFGEIIHTEKVEYVCRIIDRELFIEGVSNLELGTLWLGELYNTLSE